MVERQLERPARRNSDAGTGLPGRTSRLASAALYPQLQPSPHGPTREEVCSNQRARLCAAMIEVVVAHGYEASTVVELCTLAGVSKRTLYERFGGKRECFLATFELVVGRAVKRIVAAQEAEPDWRVRLCRAFEAFARELQDDPKGTRLALVEAFGAGSAALERMEHASGVFEGMVSSSFEQAPGDVPVAPVVVEGIVAGVARVARVRLMGGRPDELSGLASELLEWVLAYRSPVAARLDGLPRATLDAAIALAPEPVRDVREDAHARILRATGELVAESGYARLTVDRIVAAAGVSTRIFFGQFESVEQAFLAELEQLSGWALGLAGRAGGAGEDWPGGVYRAVVALMNQIARDPVFQRVAFVEVFALGPAGLGPRERLMASFVAGLSARAPGEREPSELTFQASVGAVWGIAHHHVVHGRAGRLPALAGQLAYMLLAPIVGAEEAVRCILAEHARLRAG